MEIIRTKTDTASQLLANFDQFHVSMPLDIFLRQSLQGAFLFCCLATNFHLNVIPLMADRLVGS